MEEINNNIKLKDACAEIFEKAKKIRERAELRPGVYECSELEALALDMKKVERYVEKLKPQKELNMLRNSLAASEEMEKKLRNDIMVLEEKNEKLKNTILNMSMEIFNNSTNKPQN